MFRIGSATFKMRVMTTMQGHHDDEDRMRVVQKASLKSSGKDGNRWGSDGGWTSGEVVMTGQRSTGGATDKATKKGKIRPEVRGKG